MKLETKLIAGWPKLAWVAEIPPGGERLVVHHGPCVETGEGWCVEAVWAGDFSGGDFDRTDLVFGTGVRLRDQGAVFVASGTTTDRLWYCRSGDAWRVSNSLPALLAAADLHLLADHDYLAEIRTITGGLSNYTRRIPTTSADVHVLYFNNLLYDGREFRELQKPDAAPHFQSFDDYYGFLKRTAQALAVNMSDAARTHRISALASVSSGYDAAAAAVIARHAGCTRAVTIRRATSFWRGSDSGAEIARRLGLACRAYDRTAGDYPHEEAVWAVSGRASILNWTLFDYPEPLCLFFSGCRGDMVWNRTDQSVSDPFVVPSVSDMGLCEFRLIRGVFHCVVPFWGLRHVNEIRAITRREEMQPWTLGTDYDRPIARRIIEQAGVPRGTFALRKKNTSTESYFLWPYSPTARASFKRYLRSRGVYVPPDWLVWLLRRIVALDRLIYLNVTSKLKLWDIALRIRLRLQANRLLFHWSHHEMTAMYKRPLKAAGESAETTGREG